MRVPTTANSDYSYLHVWPSVRLSAWNNSAPTGRIFMKFDIQVFFENLSRKFKFHYNRTRITGTLRDDQYTLMIISRSILLRIRKFSDKSCRENRNTHFVSNGLSSKIVPLCGDNIVQPGRPHMKIWDMRTAWWIPKATDTHSRNMLTFIAFTLQ